LKGVGGWQEQRDKARAKFNHSPKKKKKENIALQTKDVTA